MIQTYLLHTPEDREPPRIMLSSNSGYNIDTLELKLGNLTLRDVMMIIRWLILHVLEQIP